MGDTGVSASAEAAVQEELQEYLAQKGVNSLFVKIVEQLLIEKPEAPVSFIVQYLLNNFPQETSEFARVSDLESKRETPSREKEETKTAEGKEEEEEKDDEDEDEDEDDEADYLNELPEMPSKRGAGGRRVSVSAGVFDPSVKVDAVVFPKSEEEKQKLRDIMSENVLCAHLEPDDVEKIVDAFESFEIEGDNEIITQGDTEAEHYYILSSGSAVVYKNDQKLDVIYGPGDGFGELALMYNAPRAATVKSCEDCSIWRLDQMSFKQILMGAAIQKREKYMSFLENVPILKEMAEHERMVLADALRERIFTKGDLIVKQGESGDEFYLIASGSVKVERDGSYVSNLDEGSYFGEVALLTTNPRQATVTADSDVVKVLTVHRKVFQRVLGPLSDILSRNMDAYKLYLTN